MKNQTIENRKQFNQIGFENCTLWYSHREIFVFSRPKVIEESRQYLLLQTDILQKQSPSYSVAAIFVPPHRF